MKYEIKWCAAYILLRAFSNFLGKIPVPWAESHRTPKKHHSTLTSIIHGTVMRPLTFDLNIGSARD